MSAKNINRVLLTGNLTADPETFSAGCNLRIAVNGSEKSGDEWVDRASFFDVTVFGKQAEACVKYLEKGKPVAVDGRLRQDRWTTDGGDNRSKVKVIADNVQFLNAREDSGESDREPEPAAAPAGGGSSGDDDIPFARLPVPDRSTRRRDLFVGDRWMA